MKLVDVIDQVPDVQAVEMLNCGVEARDIERAAIVVVAHPVRGRRFGPLDAGDLERAGLRGGEPAHMRQVNHLVRDASSLQARHPLADFVVLGREVEDLPTLAGNLDDAVDDDAGPGICSRNAMRTAINSWTRSPVDNSSTGTAAAEFRESSLPLQRIQQELAQLGITVRIDPHVVEVVRNADGSMEVQFSDSGPTPGFFALKGSGGGFLSNEISYRTLRLRDTATGAAGRSVPVGHLHVPYLHPDTDRET